MYRRFLNNNDYLGLITPEALAQLTRGDEDRFLLAEESAEMSLVERLSENYEVEQELARGKYIALYDRRITYPVGVHIYFEGQIHEVIRSLSGFKAPATEPAWAENPFRNQEQPGLKPYSQFGTYYAGDEVLYNNLVYTCRREHGYMFGEVRIPGVEGWSRVATAAWQPVLYALWDTVAYNKAFYTLTTTEGFDNNLPPDKSPCWGEIADYTSEYNAYELTGHDYVVYGGKVFVPEMDVNADIPAPGVNLALHDPRNYNLKKHMVRLAVYELTKLIAPNNVSVVRLRDYEDSMKWLNDAANLRLNPQIPRKLSRDQQPVMDWQLATFQTDFDPYKNPWLT